MVKHNKHKSQQEIFFLLRKGTSTDEVNNGIRKERKCGRGINNE